MTATHQRTLHQVQEDCLMPDPFTDLMDSIRHQAIAEVLRCIPEADYQTLNDKIDTFHWFIPPRRWMRGGIWPFAITFNDPDSEWAPYAAVLYLSPELEEAAWDIVVGILAHELAHIILGHSLMPTSPDIYESQEQAAWDRITAWGFGREAIKARAVHRWRESYEQYLTRKLKEQD